MCNGGTVDLHPVDTAERIEGIRYVNLEIFDIGADTLARFKITGGGPHEKGARPQCTQVKIELALVVDKQCTASLGLQN